MIEHFDRRFPADLGQMAGLRRVLRAHLEQAVVGDAQIDQMILVVDEVVSNAIEHGLEYRRSAEPIRVCVESADGGLLLKIEDADVPGDLVEDLAKVFDGHPGSAPTGMVERGRGMFLITMFLEDLQIRAADGGGMRLQGRLGSGG